MSALSMAVISLVICVSFFSVLGLLIHKYALDNNL